MPTDYKMYRVGIALTLDLSLRTDDEARKLEKEKYLSVLEDAIIAYALLPRLGEAIVNTRFTSEEQIDPEALAR